MHFQGSPQNLGTSTCQDMYLNLESSLEHPWSFRPETEVLSRGEASTRPKGVTLDFTDGNSDSGMSDTSSRSAIPGRIDQGSLSGDLDQRLPQCAGPHTRADDLLNGECVGMCLIMFNVQCPLVI